MYQWMKESSEFAVEEMLLAAILCDFGSNEEKIRHYQEKKRGHSGENIGWKKFQRFLGDSWIFL